jgi:hypothetical protein
MSGVILILAHVDDTGADAVATSVRALIEQVDPASGSSLCSIEVWVIRPESLSLARWSHTVDMRH